MKKAKSKLPKSTKQFPKLHSRLIEWSYKKRNLIDAINSHQIITVRIVAEVTDEFLLIVHDVIGMIYFLPISWPKFVSTQWISCMTLCLADIFYMAL